MYEEHNKRRKADWWMQYHQTVKDRVRWNCNHSVTTENKSLKIRQWKSWALWSKNGSSLQESKGKGWVRSTVKLFKEIAVHRKRWLPTKKRIVSSRCRRWEMSAPFFCVIASETGRHMGRESYAWQILPHWNGTAEGWWFWRTIGFCKICQNDEQKIIPNPLLTKQLACGTMKK